MSNTRIAVVGCGYWGKNLIRTFYELGCLEAVSDLNMELAREFSQKYNVSPLSLEEVLESSQINAVIIAVPAEHHTSVALACLKAGKHIFVEKPLALKVEDAETIIEMAKKVNKKVMVGHLLQYHPVFLKLKEIISKGELGRLQYIYSNRLNLGKIRREENVFWSFAPHDISMILSLAGDLPEKIHTSGSSYLHHTIDDVTVTSLQFKNGIHGHIFVSWLHPFKEQKLIVIGDKGMAVFDDQALWPDKLSLYPHQVLWKEGFPDPSKAEKIAVAVNQEEPLKNECLHFLDCIARNETPRTDGYEGLRVLKVLEASERSRQTNAAITLSEVKERKYFCHESAYIDEGCEIGEGAKIWHFSHIMKGSKIGKKVIIGQNVMIADDVIVGDGCKIQNNVSLYKGVVLEEGVFCGPSCVFTNVNTPRAKIERKNEYRKTRVGKDVTIGANATIVCGHQLGEYSFIAAGAVVTSDVKPHALMAGVPARQIGWMSHAGEKLGNDLTCPREGTKYVINEAQMLCALPLAS
ncbi:MAG: Gfo/Idh/MocA family oxidoreductase [Alphaproteobacteria bacterium]|nr:Gfo/Idh/MocA family oxidoreductase [Alphaproteobacteria bacterium]